jgi:transposase-like protein
MKRKKYSSRLKFQIILESIKEDDVTGVSRRYNVSPNLVSKWRQQFRERGYEIFENGADQDKRELERRLGELERLIGHKEVEIKLLQSFFTFYESGNGKSSNTRGML